MILKSVQLYRLLQDKLKYLVMKQLILALFALATVALGAPLDDTLPIPIIRQAQVSINPETSDGTQAQQQRQLENPGTDVQADSFEVSYSYTGDEVRLALTYTAGKDGFLPLGAHIELPASIPSEIL